jgi:hypothetical protein
MSAAAAGSSPGAAVAVTAGDVAVSHGGGDATGCTSGEGDGGGDATGCTSGEGDGGGDATGCTSGEGDGGGDAAADTGTAGDVTGGAEGSGLALWRSSVSRARALNTLEQRPQRT